MANDESKLTVKAGAILALVSGLVLFILGVLFAHEKRVTILETNSATIISMLSEIRTDVKRHVEKGGGD
jgi:hypothetical protein